MCHAQWTIRRGVAWEKAGPVSASIFTPCGERMARLRPVGWSHSEVTSWTSVTCLEIWENQGKAGARRGTEGPYRRAPLTARTAAGRRHVQQHRQAVVATLTDRGRRLSVMAWNMAGAPRGVKKNLKGRQKRIVAVRAPAGRRPSLLSRWLGCGSRLASPHRASSGSASRRELHAFVLRPAPGRPDGSGLWSAPWDVTHGSRSWLPSR